MSAYHIPNSLPSVGTSADWYPCFSRSRAMRNAITRSVAVPAISVLVYSGPPLGRGWTHPFGITTPITITDRIPGMKSCGLLPV